MGIPPDALTRFVLAKVELIKAVAAARGWESKGEKAALGPQTEEATAADTREATK